MAKLRPTLDPNDMRVFATVARAGGIRSAAGQLGIPRSTVSRQLINLERSLGVRLVTRTSRRFELTQVGQTLLEQCGQLEEVLRTTERLALRGSAEPSGVLRVAASHVVGEELLAVPVTRYLARFPAVRIELALSSEFVDLRRSSIDLAIRTGPLQDASDLYAVKLGVSVKGFYASRAYLDRRGVPERPAELEAHDCIASGAETSWSFSVRGAELPVRITPRLRVDSPRTCRALAAAGAGVARLPSFYAQPLLESGELVSLLEAFAPRANVHAVHSAGVPAPVKIGAFIALLQETFGRALR